MKCYMLIKELNKLVLKNKKCSKCNNQAEVKVVLRSTKIIKDYSCEACISKFLIEMGQELKGE